MNNHEKSQMRLKEDYKKYLKEVAEQYNYGEDGKFPPTVCADRLLEFDEYEKWWKDREARVSELVKRLDQRKVW